MFQSGAAICRLVGAALLEQDDECSVRRARSLPRSTSAGLSVYSVSLSVMANYPPQVSPIRSLAPADERCTTGWHAIHKFIEHVVSAANNSVQRMRRAPLISGVPPVKGGDA